MATRMKVAEHLVGELPNDRKTVIRQAAAWLVANKKVRQADYLINDMARSLMTKGYLYARITSAHELDAASRKEIEAYLDDLGPEKVETEYLVDPGIIGGIKIETPTAELDASVRMKLDRLEEGLQS